ncbi:helix-turn-helix transcriptional regulator [Phascolarctobacterium succinatutens]|uniref:helix-turn-helix domain-containing protein n=1 Tax=Phascolarctobacterium succinatutens TaxID=626940 RepID=UPI0030782022
MLHVALPFEEKPKNKLPDDNLKYYRQRKSLTTRQLAEKMDVVPATILMYEQNKYPIPYDVAKEWI